MSSNSSQNYRWITEYSVPLLVGVAAALLMANLWPDLYTQWVDAPWFGLFSGATHHGHEAAAAHASHSGAHGGMTLHFLVNDIFMVFFFGVAAKEITEACLPGGALNPPSKAVNPLIGTLGGVLGPVGVFLGLNAVVGESMWTNGWGIPTATDIALAWLVARLIFGAGHPAISFLLLLAIADDAIGLVIIAIAYPDPQHPTVWANALWIVPGIVSAIAMRRWGVKNWMAYVAVGGSMCWYGLYSAHLHPALALVFIVPAIPGPRRDLGLFTDPVEEDRQAALDSPLERFEHTVRPYVDCGLFFFAFANAGVTFQSVSGLTWIVLASLIVGKFIGISLFSMLADRAGFRLPKGMDARHLVVTSVIAGLGLTVSLFVAGQAFAENSLQGAAKMGALASVFAAPIAWALSYAFRLSSVGIPKTISSPNTSTSDVHA